MANDNLNCSGAAIVCSHVATDGLPILYAERSEPNEPVDSGWQFLCNSGADEDVNTARIWALDEVLAIETSLREFVNLPVGTRLMREATGHPWQVVYPSG